ncbi:MAG TPA: RDD family protein [Gemmatimonadales bacterium]
MEQRVGFGPRLGALLIDCVLVGVLVAVLGGVVGGMFGAAAGGAGSALSSGTGTDAQTAAAMGGMIGALAGMIIAAAVLGLVYFLIEGFTGFTLGKLMLGIRIANADGTQAAVSKLLLRWAVKNNDFILSVLAAATGVRLLGTLGNLGFLVIFIGCFLALGASKQALHDRICDTAVWPKALVKAAM